MTINEIESRTGLERATVRYYESEGLIKPAREPNGCRNYSDADLDTGRYLAALESAPEKPPALSFAPPRTPEPVEEHPEWEPAPWRRYFARMVDWGIVELAFLFVSAKLLSIPYRGGFGYTVVLNLLLMAVTLLIEPILIWTCGATPGKWLMGLRVTDPEGENLTLGAACKRTWGVLLWGEGLMIRKPNR